jgi:uncharacterized protein involved in exopolysaccharide biosynthesis
MAFEKTPREVLYYVFFVIFRNKWLVSIVFLVTVIAFGFGTFLISPQWEATAKIIVLPSVRQQTMLFRDLSYPPPALQDTSAYDVVEMLVSNAFGEKIVQEFGLDEILRQKREKPKNFREKAKNFIVDIAMSPYTLATKLGILPDSTPNYPAKALEELIEDMQDIEVIEGTSTVQIGIWAESPDLAVRIANRLAEMATEKTTSFEQIKAEESYQFLNDHLKSIQEGLEKAEESLLDFMEENEVVDLPTEKNLILQRRDGVIAQHDAVKRDLVAAEARAQMRLKQLSSQPEKILTSEVISFNPTHRHLQNELNLAEINLASLRGKLGAQNQEILSMEARIRESRLKLEDEQERILQDEIKSLNPVKQDLTKEIIDLEARIAELSSKRQSLERVLVEMNQELNAITRSEITLERLNRLISGLQNRFITLRDKLLNLEVQRFSSFSEYDIKISDPAYIPEDLEPDWPIWPLNLAVGVFFGLVLGLGTAFFIEYCRDSLEIPKEVEKVTGMRVLGIVPSFRARRVMREFRG